MIGLMKRVQQVSSRYI